ncbi:MAG: DNA mismatch repair endonuclease MutL [Clostridia bacterium]|nr:DNA mismatch repair endonuclease MutL [Clostridia bacterium]
MAKIRVLDRHTAELIAAGEVVERPASVIKELLENAIDAGADTVTVEIVSGGIAFMRITDNGCGIAHEDVPTAFLRHATSKVRTEEDLERIGTLGFRGEALASVAAVADVKLLTCTDENELGTVYHIAGGEELEYEEMGAPKGTTITVSNLFYNVPARMKFLKKDVSEGNAVTGVVQRMALSHPEVSFRYIREGREELLTPGDGELYSCVYAVFGKQFAGDLLPVEYTLDGVRVYGYCCQPTAARANRTMQHFFINGRYVKTNTAAVALERAYHGMMMTGRFPACVLHIELPPETVDVNVHPAKIEVRFVQEKPVFDTVYHGVRAALQKGDTLKKSERAQNPFIRPVSSAPAVVQPTFTEWKKPAPSVIKPATPIEKPSVPPVIETDSDRPSFSLRDDTSRPNAFLNRTGIDIVVEEQPTAFKSPEIQEMLTPPAPAEPAPIASEPEVIPARVIGEVFSTYILAEWGEQLLVVDKHAAHERILYNEIKSQPVESASQMLLQPVAVSLESDPYNALLEGLPMLQKAGYQIEEFGSLTVLVRSVPVILSGCDVTAMIEEIAGGLCSGRRDVLTVKEDWIYHSISCRAAIKAGDVSTLPELQKLVEQVLSDPDVRYCPHGRPVCFTMTRQELEKQFGRIR